MRGQRGWNWVVVLACFLGLVACSDDDDHGGGGPMATATATATPAPSPTPLPTCDLPLPFCGGDFPLNTEMTTPYGPAWADVVLQPSNFLPCFGPYALCYYANCTVGPDGKASACPCYEWFGPNFVLDTAILNADSYQATSTQCTSDPASCRQINGAPVCHDINRGTFAAGASRISTFGFYRAASEPIGSTDCTTMPGPYAGCMTGLCAGPTVSNPDGSTTIGCDCPIFDGPYQIGKTGLTCNDAPMAWSAAYSTVVPPNPCDMVAAGACIPDAPTGECGCPLYTSSTVLPPDSGVDCTKVCNAYTTCLRQSSDVQLGFTCDATLCTSSTHDLVFDACLGLQDCDLSEVFKAETAAGCSCCASQLCNCAANADTEHAVFTLDAAQRQQGETPQCDINGTLCGTPP
jgi:hypothetical protein